MNPISINSEAFSILRLLTDGVFHTESALTKQLGYSDVNITNALKDINRLGIEIINLSGYGYCWRNPILWLNLNSILENPADNSKYYHIKILDSIDSTNNYLINGIDGYYCNNNYIPVVAAEFQTNGRGRQGHTWHTGLGDSLTFSLRWYFEKNASALSGLSLVIGIAIVRVLKYFSISDVNLKWPNDIYYNSQKLAGVLIETRRETLTSIFAVIGIGINFNLSEIVKSSIGRKVTDLLEITGKCLNRNLIFGILLSELHDVLINFEKYGFTYFKKEWISYHAYEGKSITLNLPNNCVIEGTVDGVNNDGSLCLITSMGRASFSVGAISMRMK